MTSPVGPSQQPHGYSSQIGPQDQLSPDLKEQLHHIVDLLERIKEEAHKPHPNVQKLIADFNLFDQEHTDFLSELNKHSNRAMESHTKNAFETKFHHFADELKEIKNTQDPHETDFRDALYNMQKLPHFLEDLKQSPQGNESIHQIGDLAGIFAQELRTGFKLH